jgi:hypothetical protein
VTSRLLVDQHQDLLTQDLPTQATATFSPDRVYRYALTRRWSPTGPLTVFVMLNPSTADAFTTDPTIRRCIGFARRWNTAGILVVNVFGLRATDPRALQNHPDPVGPDNDAVITAALTAEPGEHAVAVAAWGTHPAANPRIPQIRQLLAPHGLPLMCLGVTQAGHPRHPLYLPGATPLTPLPERTTRT